MGMGIEHVYLQKSWHDPRHPVIPNVRIGVKEPPTLAPLSAARPLIGLPKRIHGSSRSVWLEDFSNRPSFRISLDDYEGNLRIGWERAPKVCWSRRILGVKGEDIANDIHATSPLRFTFRRQRLNVSPATQRCGAASDKRDAGCVTNDIRPTSWWNIFIHNWNCQFQWEPQVLVYELLFQFYIYI